jgi:hypothetical protein
MVRILSTEDVDNAVDSAEGKRKNAAFSADSRWLGQIIASAIKFPLKTIPCVSANAQQVEFMTGR